MKIIVFAYSQLGYKCLQNLIERGEDIQMVFTHEDNPNEFIWFKSVAELAKDNNIPVIKSVHPNTSEYISLIQEKKPDIIFSFYYRSMINQGILDIPKIGAFNMHGSFLPKYRGRVPVNWAIIKGEKMTGVTLHYMVKAPDAGDIVDQIEIPILFEDNAGALMDKIIIGACEILERQLPLIKNGTNLRIPQNQNLATYFGGRKPSDGLISWEQTSLEIYNLIRALLPYPQYPCAFFIKNDEKILAGGAKILTDGTPTNPGTIIEESSEGVIMSCGKEGIGRIFIKVLAI